LSVSVYQQKCLKLKRYEIKHVKYDYTANLAVTGDRSEYDIESY